MAIHFSKDNTRRNKEEFLDSEVFQLYSAGLCCVVFAPGKAQAQRL